jgi:hypothetical protein
MNFSAECMERLDECIEVMNSDSFLQEKMKEGNFPPLTEEELSVVSAWLESGNPEVFKFLTGFIQGEFFQNHLRTH